MKKTLFNPYQNYILLLCLLAFSSVFSKNLTLEEKLKPIHPSDTITETLSATFQSNEPLSTTYGTASSGKPIRIEASGLTSSIKITLSNPNFEVSNGSGKWRNTITLARITTILSITIYVRLKETAPAGLNDATITFTTAYKPYDLVTTNNQVIKTPLTISANTVTKEYGNALSNGATTAFTTTGLQNGEIIQSLDADYGAGGAANANAGSYDSIILSNPIGTEFNTSNYDITYQTGNITITKAPLTITAKTIAKEYGETLSNGTRTAFTTTGLKNGETIQSLYPTYGAGAAAMDHVDTYNGTVTLSNPTGINGFNPANYDITYQAGNIVVTKAPLIITLKPSWSKAVGTYMEHFLSTNTDVNGIVESVAGFKNGQVFAALDVWIESGNLSSDPIGVYSRCIAYLEGNIAAYGHEDSPVLNDYYVRKDLGRLEIDLLVLDTFITHTIPDFNSSLVELRAGEKVSVNGIGLSLVNQVEMVFSKIRDEDLLLDVDEDPSQVQHISLDFKKESDNLITISMPSMNPMNFPTGKKMRLMIRGGANNKLLEHRGTLKKPIFIYNSWSPFFRTTETSPLSIKENITSDLNSEPLSLYPNPTSNTINIDYFPKGDSDVVFSVIDFVGNEVARESISGKKDEKVSFIFNLKDKGLSNGIYLAKVTSATETFTRKVILE